MMSKMPEEMLPEGGHDVAGPAKGTTEGTTEGTKDGLTLSMITIAHRADGSIPLGHCRRVCRDGETDLLEVTLADGRELVFSTVPLVALGLNPESLPQREEAENV